MTSCCQYHDSMNGFEYTIGIGCEGCCHWQFRRWFKFIVGSMKNGRLFGVTGKKSFKFIGLGAIKTKQAFIYDACVSCSSTLCSIYSQYTMQESDPIFIEISWMRHEQIEGKADCDAFPLDVALACSCFHQKNVFTYDEPCRWILHISWYMLHKWVCECQKCSLTDLGNRDSFHKYIFWLRVAAAKAIAIWNLGKPHLRILLSLMFSPVPEQPRHSRLPLTHGWLKTWIISFNLLEYVL